MHSEKVNMKEIIVFQIKYSELKKIHLRKIYPKKIIKFQTRSSEYNFIGTPFF